MSSCHFALDIIYIMINFNEDICTSYARRGLSKSSLHNYNIVVPGHDTDIDN